MKVWKSLGLCGLRISAKGWVESACCFVVHLSEIRVRSLLTRPERGHDPARNVTRSVSAKGSGREPLELRAKPAFEF